MAKDYLKQVVDAYKKIQKSDPSVVCLFPTKSMVTEFNDSIMNVDFPNPVAIKMEQTIKSDVRKLDNMRDARNTAGLEASVKLAVGVKVLLRTNLDVSSGLVNGSIGIITEIHKNNQSAVDYIKVRFPESDDAIKLYRDSRKIMIHPGAFLIRKQFPISIAYGLTIHKAIRPRDCLYRP